MCTKEMEEIWSVMEDVWWRQIDPEKCEIEDFIWSFLLKTKGKCLSTPTSDQGKWCKILKLTTSPLMREAGVQWKSDQAQNLFFNIIFENRGLLNCFPDEGDQVCSKNLVRSVRDLFSQELLALTNESR